VLHALLVEDNDDHAALVVDGLHGLARVQHVATADEARAILRTLVPDIVLCDLRGTSDHDAPLLTATNLRIALDNASARLRMRVPLVLTSGIDPHMLHEIAGALVDVYALPKPFSRNDLRALVARVTGVTP
jgi:CheY-like chemotaxis protein